MTKKQILNQIKMDYNTIYTKTYYYVCPDGYKISIVISDTDGYIDENQAKEILAQSVLDHLC